MITYDDFKKEHGGVNYRQYWGFIQTVDELVPADTVKVFYPRNLYSVDGLLTLTLFTEKDVWILEKQKDDLNITVHKNYQVESFSRKIQSRNRNGGSTLNVSLRSGASLQFDSKADAPNEDWVETYTGFIDDVFDLIVKAP